jgi:ABC-type phosphate transport system substrate-binding protein
MSRFKLHLVAGAGALAAVSTFAGAASAAAPATLQGGGSSLLAPYWEQSVKCWDHAAGDVPAAGPNGTYVKAGNPGTIQTPAAVSGCTSTYSGTMVAYASTGSGAGQAGVFGHDGPIVGNADGSNTTLFGTNPDGNGGKVFPTGGIQYGLSDNALVDSDVAVYYVGTGGNTYTPPGGRPAVTTGATYQHLNISAAAPLYGPLIQFPVSVDPVALAYNPNYAAGKAFVLAAGQTTLKLDRKAYCRILNGEITDWNDTYLASINGVTSLLQPGDTSAPITVVGRSDGSGSTSILTRHLGKVCGGKGILAGTNKYTDGVTTLPAAVQALSNVSLQSGSGGVAGKVNSTVGAIGYIGADYVAPYNSASGTNSFNLPAAQLQNNYGFTHPAASPPVYVAPSPAGALAAFNGINPPGAAVRADQTLWVQSTSHTAKIADPIVKAAYPIVGTTNFLGYTCYDSVAKVVAFRNFLIFNFGAQGQTILKNAGLAPVPAAWTTVIKSTFLKPTNAATETPELYMAEAVSGNAGLPNLVTSGGTVVFNNSKCSASGVTGG